MQGEMTHLFGTYQAMITGPTRTAKTQSAEVLERGLYGVQHTVHSSLVSPLTHGISIDRTYSLRVWGRYMRASPATTKV